MLLNAFIGQSKQKHFFRSSGCNAMLHAYIAKPKQYIFYSHLLSDRCKMLVVHRFNMLNLFFEFKNLSME